MRRRYLHFSLLLIFIVLAGTTIGLYSFKDGEKYNARQNKSELQLPRIKPASEYLATIKNNQHTGVINPADLKRAEEQLQSMGSSRELDLTWTQLGPDNFGGRTRAIVCDNQDATASTIFAAGVSGGIWKSTNLAITWNKVNSGNDNLYVSCMIQTPNGSIYAGTGESFASQTMSGLEDMGYSGGFMGQGIFKSTDGDNFSLIPATQPTFNDMNSDWAYVNELAYDDSKGRLYAATNTGLKYSDDDGANWSTATDTAGTALIMNAYDVQVSTAGTVIACVDNKCYLSQNGDGNSFIVRADSISLPETGVSRIEFAFAPSDATIAYASVANNLGNVYGIYRSDDGGYSWRVILPQTAFVPVFAGQGVYNNTLTVFPENPDKILLGGFILYQGEKIQEEGLFDWRAVSEGFTNPQFASYLHLDNHTNVFRNGSNNTFFSGTDGGVSKGTVSGNEYVHTASNRNYYTTQFYAIGNSGLENFNLGGSQDNGTILISGNGNTVRQGELILGGDGGPCVSSLINHEIVVVSGTAGQLLRSEDAGDNYSTQFIDGTGITNPQAFITPVALWESFNNPYSRDSVYYHAREVIEGGTTIQVRSQNSGQPFYYTLPNDVTLAVGDSLNIQDVVSSRLFVATANHLYMTKELHNFGKVPEWFEISGSAVGFIGTPQTISYSADGNHVFIGTQAGRLFRVSNLALAYNYDRADINSPSCIVSTKEIPLYVPGTTDPIDQVITSIAVDPSNPNNVLVTLGNYGNEHYLVFTENALAETPVFDSRQGNLPQAPVYSSVIEMTDNNIAVIGTEYGIFVTEDIHNSSPNWYLQADEMGTVPVFDLKQQIVPKVADEVVLVNGNEVTVIPYPGTNNYGIIYAATYGRGLMRSNTFRKPVGIEDIFTDNNLIKNELKLYPNPVTNRASIELDVLNKGDVLIHVVDMSGKVVAYKENVVVEGLNKLDINLSNLNTGTYIMKAVSGNQVFTRKFMVK
ncbi:MAG: T9SS type A sorting domain-containing protein [Bacteroidetes bacterium]|nr:T9SS type A sorting domain-containing protein [Bacteroidota bacterium]